EATSPRAFAEFADSALPSRLQAALIQHTHPDRLVGHVSRDSTAIEAREKPTKTRPPAAPVAPPPRKRGRPRKDAVRPAEPPRRIERQLGMTLPQMLADLPRHCDVGTKRNAKGHSESWVGYKLHIDSADGDIPLTCVLTSASLHDSQVAIPLATMTAARVTNLYDLMDAAYDDAAIHQHSRDLGHVPIIDVNPRATAGLKQDLAQEAKRQRLVGHRLAEDLRYDERSTAERVNAAIKDHHGGRSVQVRGMHWVEHGADMVVGRDGGHAKQALAVRHLPPFLQCALVGEERLALHEEQRKGRQADIRHAVGHLAAPLVGKGRAGRANA